jgi:hypothetical protein
MSKLKKGVLPSIEIIIILVFFLSFIIWAVSKCGATKNEYANEDGSAEESGLSDENTDSIYFSMPQPLPPKEEPIGSSSTSTGSGTTSENQPVITEVVSLLYITIDGLNMRTGPHLDSTVVEKFKLFDEVYFTGEYTDSTQQLSLGKVMANEPWVRIKSKSGNFGWVYGAGVDYRRKKREGVQ